MPLFVGVALLPLCGSAQARARQQLAPPPPPDLKVLHLLLIMPGIGSLSKIASLITKTFPCTTLECTWPTDAGAAAVHVKKEPAPRSLIHLPTQHLVCRPQARVSESVSGARQRLIDMWRREEETGPKGGRAPTSSMRYVLKQSPAVRWFFSSDRLVECDSLFYPASDGASICNTGSRPSICG